MREEMNVERPQHYRLISQLMRKTGPGVAGEVVQVLRSMGGEGHNSTICRDSQPRELRRPRVSPWLLFDDSTGGVRSGLELTTCNDFHFLKRFVPLVRRVVLDCGYNFLALDHLAKHDVLAVKVGRGHGRDEKLRAIGVRACVSHGEQERLGVPDREPFVSELHTVDRFTTSAIPSSEVAALQHEIFDNAMERRASVEQRYSLASDTPLTSAKGTEVLGGARHQVAVKLEDDAASLSAANRDIEVAPGSVAHGMREKNTEGLIDAR